MTSTTEQPAPAEPAKTKTKTRRRGQSASEARAKFQGGVTGGSSLEDALGGVDAQVDFSAPVLPADPPADSDAELPHQREPDPSPRADKAAVTEPAPGDDQPAGSVDKPADKPEAAPLDNTDDKPEDKPAEKAPVVEVELPVAPVPTPVAPIVTALPVPDDGRSADRPYPTGIEIPGELHARVKKTAGAGTGESVRQTEVLLTAFETVYPQLGEIIAAHRNRNTVTSNLFGTRGKQVVETSGPTIRLQVRPTWGQYKQLQALAEACGEPLAVVTRLVLQAYFAELDKIQPRSTRASKAARTEQETTQADEPDPAGE